MVHWLDPYELFLLDLDGTLVDTEQMQFLAYKQTLLKRGFVLDWTFFQYCLFANNDKRTLGEAVYEKFPQLFELEPVWANIKKEKDLLYQQMVAKEGCSLSKGVESFLLYLQKKGKTVCVVTNSSLEQTQHIRKAHKIIDEIPYWVVRQHYKEPKPNPECYQKAIELYGKKAQKIIGFEDGLKGLAALCQTKAQPVLLSVKDHPQMKNPLPKGVLHFESFVEVLPHSAQ